MVSTPEVGGSRIFTPAIAVATFPVAVSDIFHLTSQEEVRRIAAGPAVAPVADAGPVVAVSFRDRAVREDPCNSVDALFFAVEKVEAISPYSLGTKPFPASIAFLNSRPETLRLISPKAMLGATFRTKGEVSSRGPSEVDPAITAGFGSLSDSHNAPPSASWSGSRDRLVGLSIRSQIIRDRQWN